MVRYKVCIEGTPGSVGSLRLGNQSFRLKEQTFGKYCGAFPLGGNLTIDAKLGVELRTPYGTVITKDIPNYLIASCRPSNLVASVSSGKFSLNCKESKDSEICSKEIQSCQNTKLLVFQGKL